MLRTYSPQSPASSGPLDAILTLAVQHHVAQKRLGRCKDASFQGTSGREGMGAPYLYIYIYTGIPVYPPPFHLLMCTSNGQERGKRNVTRARENIYSSLYIIYIYRERETTGLFRYSLYYGQGTSTYMYDLQVERTTILYIYRYKVCTMYTYIHTRYDVHNTSYLVPCTKGVLCTLYIVQRYSCLYYTH